MNCLHIDEALSKQNNSYSIPVIICKIILFYLYTIFHTYRNINIFHKLFIAARIGTNIKFELGVGTKIKLCFKENC